MNRQKQIIQVFENNKQLILTKSEIKEKGGIVYHNNTDKYLGETLARMVKNNSLQRIAKGNYKLGSGTKIIVQPENQTEIF